MATEIKLNPSFICQPFKISEDNRAFLRFFSLIFQLFQLSLIKHGFKSSHALLNIDFYTLYVPGMVLGEMTLMNSIKFLAPQDTLSLKVANIYKAL